MGDNNIHNEPPSSWSDIRIVVLGDSHVGGLSFKDIPSEERPKLRIRSFKGARLHKLLPLVDSEITTYKPDLVVLSIGQCDLVHFGCQHFPKPDHQHQLCKISYDFKIKLAATEIFQHWHKWLSKYTCRVLIALTYPLDIQEINYRKLKHCTECQEEYYTGEDQREILIERISEWGELLKEQDVPVMYLDDVMDKINPDYKVTDAAIEETERALVDGKRPSVKFGKFFFESIQENCERIWPEFFNTGQNSEVDGQNSEVDEPPNQPEPPPLEKPDENGDEPSLALPARKMPRIRF